MSDVWVDPNQACEWIDPASLSSSSSSRDHCNSLPPAASVPDPITFEFDEDNHIYWNEGEWVGNIVDNEAKITFA